MVDVDIYDLALELLDPAKTVELALQNLSILNSILGKWLTCRGSADGKFGYAECIIAYGKLLPLFPWLRRDLILYIGDGIPVNVEFSADMLKHIFAIAMMDKSLLEIFNLAQATLPEGDILAKFYFLQNICTQYDFADKEREDLIKTNFRSSEFEDLYTQYYELIRFVADLFEFEKNKETMFIHVKKEEMQIHSDHFVIGNRFRNALTDIHVALCANVPILIEGEAGVGKTAIITEACRMFGNGKG